MGKQLFCSFPKPFLFISSLAGQILIFHRLIQSMNKSCVLFYFCLGTKQLIPTQALERSISSIYPFIPTQQPFIHSQPRARHRLLKPSGCQIGESKSPHRCWQFNGRFKQVETIWIQSIHVVRKEPSGTTAEDRVIWANLSSGVHRDLKIEWVFKENRGWKRGKRMTLLPNFFFHSQQPS